ncbi:PREDICTED: ankyrin repeat domain-containing protein SOWAHA-like [Vollenhovia emeryi]|uniref:ankyrin repeat domain-containing protein SOWAHA-like n=1 Tax=Vollenhovia emeryi TaxID=411798 RepID=UPI0005F474A0|nr:PREDICTED: ankyrin repeat domain-containing protein SOWAHA-like [Vollenhovia emeryi]
MHTTGPPSSTTSPVRQAARPSSGTSAPDAGTDHFVTEDRVLAGRLADQPRRTPGPRLGISPSGPGGPQAIGPRLGSVRAAPIPVYLPALSADPGCQFTAEVRPLPRKKRTTSESTAGRPRLPAHPSARTTSQYLRGPALPRQQSPSTTSPPTEELPLPPPPAGTPACIG